MRAGPAVVGTSTTPSLEALPSGSENPSALAIKLTRSERCLIGRPVLRVASGRRGFRRAAEWLLTGGGGARFLPLPKSTRIPRGHVDLVGAFLGSPWPGPLQRSGCSRSVVSRPCPGKAAHGRTVASLRAPTARAHWCWASRLAAAARTGSHVLAGSSVHGLLGAAGGSGSRQDRGAA